MDEFNNRVDAQREVLEIINSNFSNKEELCGLSEKAIKRWIAVNHQDANGEMVRILFIISEKLFFLANKSQEQITKEYADTSVEVEGLCIQLKKIVGEEVNSARTS